MSSIPLRSSSRRRWAPLVYLPALVLAARHRRMYAPPPAPLTVAAVYTAPIVVARALPPGRTRDYLTWLAHMWAYKVAFEVPYDWPDQLRARLNVDSPVAIDRRLGLGAPLGQRLQRRLRRPPELTRLDKAIGVLYLLWEIEPHAALAYIRERHPERFRRGAIRMALTFDSTLIGYFAVPTAPPWWASEFGNRMDGEVRRVSVEVLRALRRTPRPGSPDDHLPGANPWAAWPSDHFGSALSAGLMLAEADPKLGAVGLAYAFGLAFALVYLGEHYVVDLLLGGGTALLVEAGLRLLDSGRGGS